ncbi:hypothetical protein [Streptomyces sp. NPDC057939]
MTITKEELVWSVVRLFAVGIGGMLLCAVVIIIVMAFAVAIKERTRAPRR